MSPVVSLQDKMIKDRRMQEVERTEILAERG